MRRRYSLPVLFLLSLCCLAFIAMHAASPLLYSPSHDAYSPGQVNPAALERMTGDRAAQVVPLMNDLLKSPNTLVLNLNAQDFEYAARDLQEYGELTRRLDTLVINLDMTDSELEEFRRANHNNQLILSELLNRTERWSDLRTLEIRYQDSGDSGVITSITYEGESLRSRIRELYDEYQSQNEIMLETGEKFGLDTEEYRSSDDAFLALVQQVEDVQEDRISTPGTGAAPDGHASLVSFDIDQNLVRYLDSITMAGRIIDPDPSRSGAEIFIDSQKAGSVPVRPDGSFSYRYEIEAVPSGTHTTFAVYADSIFSELRTFRVEETGTVLTLENPLYVDGQISCTGVLRAGSRPVRGVAVAVLIDGKERASAVTDGNGEYHARVRTSPGIHLVKTSFDRGSFPLTSAESPGYEVMTAGESTYADSGGFPLLQAVVLVVTAAVSLAVALWYARRRGRRIMEKGWMTGENRAGPEPDSTTGESLLSPAPCPPLPDADLSETPEIYHDITGVNLRDASSSLFTSLRLAAARYLALRHPLSLTPRELCTTCKKTPAKEDVCRFTRIYEAFRYGKKEIPDDSGKFEAIKESFSAAVKDMEGDFH